ncbi:MAG: hypothetical protein AB7S88_02300 [Candidatus Izemoplasmatales bacterium]
MFPNLEKAMRESSITIRHLAKEMHLPARIMKRKLEGKSPMTLHEIEQILLLFPSIPFRTLFHETTSNRSL